MRTRLGARCVTCNTKMQMVVIPEAFYVVNVATLAYTGCLVCLLRGEKEQPRAFLIEWKKLEQGEADANVPSIP